jgi:hypothetical protein
MNNQCCDSLITTGKEPPNRRGYHPGPMIQTVTDKDKNPQTPGSKIPKPLEEAEQDAKDPTHEKGIPPER